MTNGKDTNMMMLVGIDQVISYHQTLMPFDCEYVDGMGDGGLSLE